MAGEKAQKEANKEHRLGEDEFPHEGGHLLPSHFKGARIKKGLEFE
jgi:hypothetical protein